MERSEAWNDGYSDGRMGYNKDCPYDDMPNIKEYTKGYSQGLQNNLIDEH